MTNFESWKKLFFTSFNERVINPPDGVKIDQEMLQSFNDARKAVGETELTVDEIKNKDKILLNNALLYLFGKDNGIPDNLLVDNYEQIDVNSSPVEMKNKTETPEFEKRVLELFTNILSHGHKFIASGEIAKHLKVDLHELEKWLDKDKNYICKKGDTPGIFYYGLAKIEGSFTLGSDEFVRQLIQILTEDEKKWKSSTYLAAKTSVEEADFITWADKNSLLYSHPSSKDKGKKLYALGARVESNVKKKEESPAKQETKVVKIVSSVSDEERFALAGLQMLCDDLIRLMDFYGNKIAVRHEDAFGYLTRAEKTLRSGICILKSDLKIDDKKLPPLGNL